MAETPNLLERVRADHLEIKTLMTDVGVASEGTPRQEAFERLVRKVAVHETAEEEIVHPLTRRAPAGNAIAEQRLQEEAKGKAALAALEKMGTFDPRFDAEFQSFRREVLDHAEHEEMVEHPVIQQKIAPERLQQLGSAFAAAETVAPTHPHPHGPESAVANIVVGPLVAIIDRVRDAVRAALVRIPE